MTIALDVARICRPRQNTRTSKIRPTRAGEDQGQVIDNRVEDVCCLGAILVAAALGIGAVSWAAHALFSQVIGLMPLELLYVVSGVG